MMNRYVMSLLLSSMALPGHAAVSEPAGISAALRPAPEEVPAFVLGAKGVQIYVCKAKGNEPYEYAWAFVAPEATLAEGGAVVGRHFAGPTWESSGDKSSAKGAVRERQDGGAGNIPWLRLAATSSEGAGRFAGVTSVLRVATQGGIEPQGGCGVYQVGQEVRVPYTADYYFYKKK
jgi:Protein of unknown function (DUF3455)